MGFLGHHPATIFIDIFQILLDHLNPGTLEPFED